MSYYQSKSLLGWSNRILAALKAYTTGARIVHSPTRRRVLSTAPSTDGWHLSLHIRRPGWHRSTLRHAPLHSLLHIPNKLNMRGCDGARWHFRAAPAASACL